MPEEITGSHAPLARPVLSAAACGKFRPHPSGAVIACSPIRRAMTAQWGMAIPLVSWSELRIGIRCDIAIDARDAHSAQHRGLAPAGVTHMGRDPRRDHDCRIGTIAGLGRAAFSGAAR